MRTIISIRAGTLALFFGLLFWGQTESLESRISTLNWLAGHWQGAYEGD